MGLRRFEDNNPTMRAAPFLFILSMIAACVHAEDKPRPLMRDFIGLCGHTVQFKPDLYAPVTRMVRDYHPIEWDLGDDTSSVPPFPFARNRVDWSKVYGSWVKAGYRIEASLMFDNLAPAAWKDIERDARAYGRAFAMAFGPSAKTPLVEAIEIGNEPGKYDDATYRKLFTAMASGAREGDPRLRIATCAANLGPSGRYSKTVDLLTGLEPLYDIVNIHQYAEITGWPTWRRSYAEDPKTKFLENIGHVLKWRDQHAPGKEVWLTEFGWDATTKPNLPTGDFAKWEGSTETQQAQWIVRAYLVLAATSLDRAYLYFFNDDDTPQLHGSSGLTRNFQPKPAFHAVAHLQRTLGDSRFTRVIRESTKDGYAYEFISDAGQRIWAMWKPEGANRKVTLPTGTATIVKAERTPLVAGEPERVETVPIPGGGVEVEAGELPVFLWLDAR